GGGTGGGRAGEAPPPVPGCRRVPAARRRGADAARAPAARPWPGRRAAPAPTPWRRGDTGSGSPHGYGGGAVPSWHDHREAWKMDQGGVVRMERSRLVWVLAALVIGLTAWIAYPHVRNIVIPSEETSAARGHGVAVWLGCFACHGPGGGGGVHNPGSKEGEVPAFTEQTQMMYVKTSDDLREYVLDGAPKRRREDPDYVAKMKEAGLH